MHFLLFHKLLCIFFSPHKSQVMISQVRVIGMFFYVIGVFFTCFKQNCVVLCSLQKKQSHQNLEYFLLLCYLLTFKNSGVSWLLTPNEFSTRWCRVLCVYIESYFVFYTPPPQPNGLKIIYLLWYHITYFILFYFRNHISYIVIWF